MPEARHERTRSDAPAAFPLGGYAAGLAAAGSLLHPVATALGLIACAILLALRRRRALSLLALFAAAGIAAGAREGTIRAREDIAFAALASQRFATIEAPVGAEWSRRGASHLLRCERFRANGVDFDRPLIVYARFDPPPVAMHATLRAEGFLQRNERGTYTLAVKSPRLLSYHGELAPLAPQRWNRALLHRLSRVDRAHADAVALAAALALGRAERLTEPVRDSFRRAGTYHLLVFSGLQIAVAAGAIAWLLRALGRPRASDWLLLFFSALAPLFIGATASVSRASIGIGVFALTRILRRPTSVENLWCVSALARLILEPEDLTNVSFQLTYAGAGALLFMAKAFTGSGWKWLVAAIGAEMAITPLTLFHFHQFALGGSLLTLVLTPVIFAMLVAAVVLIAVPSAPAIFILEGLHALCIAINAFGSPAAGFAAAPPAWALAAGFGGAVAAVGLLIGRRRAAAIFGCLAIPLLVSLASGHHAPPVPSLTLLDVGQGDAIIVRSNGTTLLVDGGGGHQTNRFGEAVLLPMLADRGVRRIDAVALSHAHPDHCGGLAAVLRHLDVGELWISPRRFSGLCAAELLDAARESATAIRLLRDGDRLSLPGIHITAITASRRFKRAHENNASVVLRLQLESARVLLTGDIERDAERALAGRFGTADVVKIAHHGSRSSTTEAFLDETRPRIALISCGRHNLFGHPHPAVVEALRRRGIRTWRTDENGSIDLRVRRREIFTRPEIDTPR